MTVFSKKIELKLLKIGEKVKLLGVFSFKEPKKFSRLRRNILFRWNLGAFAPQAKSEIMPLIGCWNLEISARRYATCAKLEILKKLCHL